MTGVLALVLNEMAGLHKHTAGTAGRIKDNAVVRFDDVNDGLHERGRGEKFAVVLCPLHGELHQEVFVNPPEDITAGILQCFRIKFPQDIFQQLVFKLVILFGELAAKWLKFSLDGIHSINQCSAKVCTGREF